MNVKETNEKKENERTSSNVVVYCDEFSKLDSRWSL
jgi:hypothetical protein